MSSFYNTQTAISYGSIESNNEDGTTNVLTNNGFITRNINIQSTTYPGVEPLTGGIKYPPLNAQVIIIHPVNDIASGFIMPAPLDYRDPVVQEEILGQGDRELLEGGWIKTFDPLLGILTFTHKDFEDLIFTINPDTKITNYVDFNGNKFTFDEIGISVEDFNGNKFFLDGDGISVADLNGNTSLMDSSGITVEDANGNSYAFSAVGVSIADANGNEITQDATGISLKTGDATIWMPNILPACLFTGASHGGSAGGIVKLKGG